MKTNQFLALGLATCLPAFLPSCGGDDAEAPRKVLEAEEKAPPVKATEVAKEAALGRIDTMKKITVVLKPLRDSAAALAKEEELKALFAEYNRLTKVAQAEGVSGRQLARLTAELAPGSWVDTRTEFQQYLLLVRQLGEPQREMMDRLTKAGAAPATKAK